MDFLWLILCSVSLDLDFLKRKMLFILVIRKHALPTKQAMGLQNVHQVGHMNGVGLCIVYCFLQSKCTAVIM